jgi:cell division protein FtsZ
VLRQAVEGISDLITTPRLINVHIADIRAVLAEAGTPLMGIGVASGENRAVEAAKMAINSPLLDISINGARGVLFAIAGSEDMTMNEVQEAAKVITESVDANARVIFGAIIDPKLRKGEIKITVIASGFPEEGRGKREKRENNKVGAAATQSKKDETLFAEPEEKFIDALEKDRDETERAIFNTIPEEKTHTVNVKHSEHHAKKEDEDDDLGVIPSFLRRSKLR